jgi:hypothetical protein
MRLAQLWVLEYYGLDRLICCVIGKLLLVVNSRGKGYGKVRWAILLVPLRELIAGETYTR